jgi:hypothetical protein
VWFGNILFAEEKRFPRWRLWINNWDFWMHCSKFVAQINTMDEQANHKHELKDVKTDWVSTSRFLFYLSVVAVIAFSLAMCYGLYAHRYKGKPHVEVPSSTLYNPVYK